jgi:hypothetical protein
MFISIKPAIFQFSKRPDITVKINEQEVRKNWEKIIASINKQALNNTDVLYLNSANELVVKVKNHLWMQEMVFYKKELLNALNGKGVKTIRFVAG